MIKKKNPEISFTENCPRKSPGDDKITALYTTIIILYRDKHVTTVTIFILQVGTRFSAKPTDGVPGGRAGGGWWEGARWGFYFFFLLFRSVSRPYRLSVRQTVLPAFHNRFRESVRSIIASVGRRPRSRLVAQARVPACARCGTRREGAWRRKGRKKKPPGRGKGAGGNRLRRR